MKASLELINFLKGWESCRLQPYQDSGGKWTAGWGSLLREGEDTNALWSQEKADARFTEELEEKEAAINSMLPVWILQQHEFDALVSFAYNKGTDALRKSTLLRLVKEGRMGTAAAEFTRWEKVQGRLNHGVLRRSCAEQAVFLAKDYTRRP